VPENETSSESGTSPESVTSEAAAGAAPRSPLDWIVLALATGLGTGLSPWAPGTVGSLLGPPLVWGCSLVLPPIGLLVVGILFIAVGPPICTRASKLLGKHDPGSVVYDEVAAFWIVFLPQLAMKQELTWPILIAGFVLFRIFDISKPWPVNRLEKLPDGTGIMADDLAAGAMAAIILASATWAGFL
jgi:phosphatidylglycerophosphatase A